MSIGLRRQTARGGGGGGDVVNSTVVVVEGRGGGLLEQFALFESVIRARCSDSKQKTNLRCLDRHRWRFRRSSCRAIKDVMGEAALVAKQSPHANITNINMVVFELCVGDGASNSWREAEGGRTRCCCEPPRHSSE